MSSRYSICANASQLAKRFSIEVSAGYKPFYNAAPTHLLPVITNTGPNGASFFYWGTAPEFAKNKPVSEKLINVGAELISEKAIYKKMIAQHRCLVPADGFYEWKKLGKKTQVPYRYTLQNKELFSMAGMWEEYEGEKGEQFHTFIIITCPSNDLVAITSERMPVILPREVESLWLSAELSMADLLSLLVPYDASKMDYYAVSPRIASTTANQPSLILPTPPSDQFGNLTLFD